MKDLLIDEKVNLLPARSGIACCLKTLPLAVALATASIAAQAVAEQGKSSSTTPALTVSGSLINTIGQGASSAATFHQGAAARNEAMPGNVRISVQQAIKAEQLRRPSRSGLKHQFDPTLGKATFIWGSAGDTTAGANVIAADKRKLWAANYHLQRLTGLSVAGNDAKVALRSASAQKKQTTSEAYLVNLHDHLGGPIVAKYRQRVQGIEVFNREMNILLDWDLNMVASAGYLTERNELPSSVADFTFDDAQTAIRMAFEQMGGDSGNITLNKSKKDGVWQYFDAENGSSSDLQLLSAPRAKKVIYDLMGELTAAYYVELQTAAPDDTNGDYFAFVIDTQGRQVLMKNNLKSETTFSYRVYADPQTLLPEDGPHGDVTPAQGPDQVDPSEILEAPLVTLKNGPISTGDPWLENGAGETDGNNVFAYADVVAPQGFTFGDFSAPVTASGIFDYALQANDAPNSRDNRHAAIVNLFYLNNFLHDWYYDHGFDEASGNAQAVNFGRGGVEGDPLLAEAQDSSGFNNANMATPADGASPVMQMFLFDSKDTVPGDDFGVFVNCNVGRVFLTSSQTAGFGPLRFSTLTGEAVRIDDGSTGPDGTGTETDGCEELINPEQVTGKIALIDRGSCDFPLKVFNAQQAGAIAAVVINNEPGDEPAPMGGDDPNVKIPSMGLSNNDGLTLIDPLEAGETVALEMFNNRPFKDGTFDNSIIAHEWGHYISNRLIGNGSGLINNQGNSMGEGWADFHALLLLVREADQNIPGNDAFQAPYPSSTFVGDFFTGGRRVPYSTNLELNPLTFKHIESGVELPNNLPSDDNSEVHNSGEVWASMLWDGYVSLINTHGFAKAQDRMLDYLVAGYKLTPVAPTYTEARDALLAAAFAVDSGDYRLLLEAFARRGMGLGAVSPERFDEFHTGVVESYESQLPIFRVNDFQLAIETDTAGDTQKDGILQAGESGTVTVSIGNIGSEVLSGLQGQLEVLSDHRVRFDNNGTITFDSLNLFENTTAAPLGFTLEEGPVAEELVLRVVFPEQDGDQPVIVPAPETLSVPVNYKLLPKAPLEDTTEDTLDTLAAPFDWVEVALKPGSEAARLFIPSNTPFDAQTTVEDLGFAPDSEVMFIEDRDSESDVAYETRSFNVGFAGDFRVSFDHWYRFETGFDGGVLEVSVNGSEFQDVLTIPDAAFEGSGYTGALDGADDTQSLRGRDTFNDLIPGGVMERETINFGTALNGNQVRLRFRVASDFSVGDNGWLIDNISVTNVASPIFSCVAVPDAPVCEDNTISVIADSIQIVDVDDSGNATEVSVSATIAAESTAGLRIQWEQLAGPAVDFSGATTETIRFAAPDVSEDTTLTFSVSARGLNGETAKTQVSVTVRDSDSQGGETPETPETPEAPEAPETPAENNVENDSSVVAPPARPTTPTNSFSSGSSSGGGGFGWIGLLMLLFLTPPTRYAFSARFLKTLRGKR